MQIVFTFTSCIFDVRFIKVCNIFCLPNHSWEVNSTKRKAVTKKMFYSLKDYSLDDFEP